MSREVRLVCFLGFEFLQEWPSTPSLKSRIGLLPLTVGFWRQETHPLGLRMSMEAPECLNGFAFQIELVCGYVAEPCRWAQMEPCISLEQSTTS
jgi:hypothetical protein